MEYFRPDVKVGGVILLSLALLAFAAMTVGNFGDWFTTKRRYTVLFSNANLLPKGTRVAYAGYPVGHVSAVRVNDGDRADAKHPVALTITVTSHVQLREDSRVEMKTDGFIGDRYLDIVPGTGAPLPDNSEIEGSMGGFEGMLASLSGVQGGTEDLLNKLNRLLGDAAQPDSIPGTLTRLNRLLDDLGPSLAQLADTGSSLLGQVQHELVQTSGKAGRTLDSVTATITENRPGLQRLVGDLSTSLLTAQKTMDGLQDLLNTSQGDVARLMQDMHALLEGLEHSREAMMVQIQQLLNGVNQMLVQNDRNIYATIENLRDMTANLEATTQLLRANPAVLLWGTRNNHNPDATPSTLQRTRALQDRGRVGRYDRTP